MIYSKRSGSQVFIARRAVIGDVKKFENRRADASDRRSIANQQYFICTWADGSNGEFLAAMWFLCADGGINEIVEASVAAEEKRQREREEMIRKLPEAPADVQAAFAKAIGK